MTQNSKRGTESSGSQTNRSSRQDFSLDDTITFAGQPGAGKGVDDAVVDEILRSISSQSGTPVPNTPSHAAWQSHAAEGRAPQSQVTRPASTWTGNVPGNSYAAAKAHHIQEAQAAQAAQTGHAPQATTRVPQGVPGGQSGQPERPQWSTGPVPDPSYYAMRDPNQTQSFQPARPAHRDTDRLPTLVEEKPVRRQSALSKVLTFLVAILVVVALVLGVRMAYILGPSMGWNLPDLSQLPGISILTGMLPEENLGETVGNDTVEDENEEETETTGETPTTVTLDQETLTLGPGEVAILTATVDTDWNGTVVWASGDENVATVTSIGNNIAQVEYVGEGTCSIAAVIPAGVQETGPSAYCRVTCGPAAQEEEAQEQPAEETTQQEETQEPTQTHVDVVLNREDFTLRVGERHQLMDENADQVTWSSSDESVATVDGSGIVTAVAPGNSTITATGPDGTTASAIARVKN